LCSVGAPCRFQYGCIGQQCSVVERRMRSRRVVIFSPPGDRLSMERTMPRKRHKSEEIIAKLRQVDVLTAACQPARNILRGMGRSALRSTGAKASLRSANGHSTIHLRRPAEGRSGDGPRRQAPVSLRAIARPAVNSAPCRGSHSPAVSADRHAWRVRPRNAAGGRLHRRSVWRRR